MNNCYCIDDKSSNIVNEIFADELFTDVLNFLFFVMIDDDINNNEKSIMWNNLSDDNVIKSKDNVNKNNKLIDALFVMYIIIC